LSGGEAAPVAESFDNAGQGSAAPMSSKLSPRLWAILVVVMIADVLDLMDSTVTTIAAPTIARELGGGEGLIKWLGASYSLAMGVFLVIGGRLGDKFGRRRMFLIGWTGFVLASAWCAVSTDPAMLITARFIQGAFGALLIPQGIGILITSLNRAQQPTAFVIFGPVLGASAIAGPILAGFIISANIAGLTWRPVFLINIVLGAVTWPLAARSLPHDKPTAGTTIDLAGGALLGAAMLGISGGLIEGSTNGWTSPPIAYFIAGFGFLIAFGWRQVTTANPLILPSLLKNRGFTSGLMVGLGYFAGMNGLAYVVSLYFQQALGLSAGRAAVALSPLMVGIIAASFIARPLLAKAGRAVVTSGLFVTVAGAVALWFTTRHQGDASVWVFAPAVFILGVGMGLCVASIYDVAVGDVKPEEAGGASGSLSAVQQLATAIGSAVVTTIYFDNLTQGAARAMELSVAVVGAIAFSCLALVRLMPRTAAPDPDMSVDDVRAGSA
jgi:EmrB/QacA subfamily drug resistance transporter